MNPYRQGPERNSTASASAQERADALFDELSSVLRHAPDEPDNAVNALRAADRAFDDLHAWLRAGNPLPGPWRRGRGLQE
ncbi:hypothetical protein [Nocardiopsis halotolerans]|uniref:hypothetical protein n=1 Tax=Nocardiopsis halotolerans TaxID=124252 RepID=UPI000346447F|nr:hypothetical protein [Nocardiopsis halotolerans]